MLHFDTLNMRNGEVACNKQFLLFSQCFLPYMVLIFHFKCILKCRLQFVSIWASLKFCHLVMGLMCAYICLFFQDPIGYYMEDPFNEMADSNFPPVEGARIQRSQSQTETELGPSQKVFCLVPVVV